MRRSLAFLAALAWAPTARPADPGPIPPDLAARAWAITDAVLARHVDPPARQQLLLAGLKALHPAGPGLAPPGLARRASGLETPEQFAALLAEAWPRPLADGARPAPEAASPEGGETTFASPRAPEDRRTPEGAFLAGLLAAVPGGAEVRSAKEQGVAEQLAGNTYVGIQVALEAGDGHGPSFAQVLEGGPADRAGAKAGDVIEAIDGASTEGMPLADLVDRIRGEEGTRVVIRLRRKGLGRTEDVPMTRGRLPRVTVEGHKPRLGGGWEVRLDGPVPIGYLKVKEVAGSTPQEVRALAAQLETEGARALVLDLREAGRAEFHPTVLLADALLDGGTIGRVREADAERVVRAEPDALFRDWPIAVLADGPRSPEVAWLCAALEDNRRAKLVGRRDAGPGVVRSAVPILGGAWSVAMMTGRLARGDGKLLAAPATDPRRAGPEGAGMSGGGDATLDPYAAPLVFRLPRRGEIQARPTASDPLAEARALLEAALMAAGI